ncbi:MAG: phospho-N-acetylmuramoyl-pentapeptide-transferase [Defluviitaleaceae bacterium]|nr:phospho-N-acetylmuramoyl-pentapeptide-transferase [Defluviitaleaceae bacterium]
MRYDLSKAVYAALGAFAVSAVLCPTLIPFLMKLKVGQYVRDDGPKEHLKKAGTPTMGGIVIIASFAVASLFFVRHNPDAVAIILVTVACGLMGFWDDYTKIVRKRSLGLRAWQKIVVQLIITTAFTVYLYQRSGPNAWEIYIPFTHGQTWNLGGWYIPLVFIVILGTMNGSNLTDGLDGLNSGVTALISAFFLFAAWAMGSGSLPLAGAAVGALLGFLLFNSYPAKIMMGDTGSQALGGFVAAIALILRMPLFLVIVALIYVIESLSVMIQVGVFKLTHKRVFKMAPIHHSFELSGWSETRVVALFYIITAIMCLIGYLGGQHIVQ